MARGSAHLVNDDFPLLVNLGVAMRFDGTTLPLDVDADARADGPRCPRCVPSSCGCRPRRWWRHVRVQTAAVEGMSVVVRSAERRAGDVALKERGTGRSGDRHSIRFGHKLSLLVRGSSSRRRRRTRRRGCRRGSEVERREQGVDRGRGRCPRRRLQCSRHSGAQSLCHSRSRPRSAGRRCAAVRCGAWCQVGRGWTRFLMRLISID